MQTNPTPRGGRPLLSPLPGLEPPTVGAGLRVGRVSLVVALASGQGLTEHTQGAVGLPRRPSARSADTPFLLGTVCQVCEADGCPGSSAPGSHAGSWVGAGALASAGAWVLESRSSEASGVRGCPRAWARF